MPLEPGSAISTTAPQTVVDPATMRVRSVHRAIAELRRGTPVLLLGESPAVVLAAETASAAGLADLARLIGASPTLLLAPVRAAALLRRPVAAPGPSDPTVVAFRTAGLLEPDVLRGIADPTAAQLLADPPELAPTPPGAAAALALAKLARLLPAAIAAPAARGAAEHAAALGLLAVEPADVLDYPDEIAASLRIVAEASVPLAVSADARVVAFRGPDAGIEHLAIVIGDPATAQASDPAPLVRLHSECFTGDLLGSLRCDCGPQLHAALERIAADGAGVLLYLAQEGRGIGLASKLRAYTLQDRGLDTVDANRALGWQADERNFMVAATMLEQLGLHRIRLLTNNPDKLAALAACGVTIEARAELVIPPNGVNDHYLATKARRFGHLL